MDNNIRTRALEVIDEFIRSDVGAYDMLMEYDFDFLNSVDFGSLCDILDPVDAYNLVYDFVGGNISSWDSWYYDEDNDEVTDEWYDAYENHSEEVCRDILEGYECGDGTSNDDLDELLDKLFKHKTFDELYDLVQNGYQSEMVYIYDNIHNHTHDAEYGGDGYGYFEVIACPKIVDMCRVLDMLKRTKFCGVPEDKYGEVYNEIADSSINLVKVIVEKAYEDKPKHVSIERYAELFIKERWCK